jgi:transcriptional regulator of acetoin/glycerol metabolism
MAKRSLAGLNAINFFQAEMVGVVLPVLGSFLKQAHWRYGSIGIATALSGLGTLFPRAVVDAKEHWIEELTALPLHDSVAEWERFRIRKALTDSAGNKAEAARRLGIHRRLLYEKLKAFGLGSASEEQADA